MAKKNNLSLFTNLVYGGIAGILAGLVFAILMMMQDMFVMISQIVGMSDAATGFIVHIIVSFITGAIFALFFFRVATTIFRGLSFGLIYGVIWWFIGPLTMLPLLLGKGFGVSWNLEAMTNAIPSLIGHVIFGLILGLFFGWFVKTRKQATVSTGE